LHYLDHVPPSKIVIRYSHLGCSFDYHVNKLRCHTYYNEVDNVENEIEHGSVKLLPIVVPPLGDVAWFRYPLDTYLLVICQNGILVLVVKVSVSVFSDDDAVREKTHFILVLPHLGDLRYNCE
jgi:hypothetical protein